MSTPQQPGQSAPDEQAEKLAPHSPQSADVEPHSGPRVYRPDPEDPPTGPAEELDDDFDPAAAPSNPDLVGPDPDELKENP